MKNNNLISTVVVVVEKDKKFLKECLLSLEKSAKQAKTPIDFIVIANGTNLSEPIYLKSSYKVINNKVNIGFGAAVNIGVDKAIGQFCIITCPDVITDKNCIKNLLKQSKKEKIAIIGPKIKVVEGELQHTILPIPTPWQIFLEQSYLYKIFPRLFKSPLSDKELYLKTHYIDAVAAIWWLVKTKIFRQIGGLDPRFFLYFEDVDLCRRLKEVGYLIAYEPSAKVLHLMHKSTGGNPSGKLYFHSLKAYLLKYYSKLTVYFTLNIFRLGCLLRLIFWQTNEIFTTDAEKLEFGRQKIIFCKEAIIG